MSNSTISTTAFHCDDNKITDPSQIANRFCHYFSNIGINLTRKVPNSLVLPCEFLKGNFSKSFFLHPVTKCEMSELKLLKALSLEKQRGMIIYPCMGIIKQSIEFISSPLMHIINLSFAQGILSLIK